MALALAINLVHGVRLMMLVLMLHNMHVSKYNSQSVYMYVTNLVKGNICPKP